MRNKSGLVISDISMKQATTEKWDYTQMLNKSSSLKIEKDDILSIVSFIDTSHNYIGVTYIINITRNDLVYVYSWDRNSGDPLVESFVTEDLLVDTIKSVREQAVLKYQNI